MTIRKGLGLKKGMGYKNLIPKYDAHRHSLNAKGYKMPQRMPNFAMKGGKEMPDPAEEEFIEAMDKETLDLLKEELGFKDEEITSFREEESGVYSIEIGGQEYYVFEDEDKAEEFAKERVLEDLENNPEYFTQSWLEGFIDTDNLKDQLEDDVNEMNRSYYTEIADENDREYQNRQIAELVQGGYLDDDDVRDKDGELLDYDDIKGVDDAVEKAVEEMTDEKLEDPIEYLKEMYSEEDAMKKAIEIGGINYDEAVDDAIAQDGWEHFVGTYDGTSTGLKNGVVLVRTN